MGLTSDIWTEIDRSTSAKVKQLHGWWSVDRGAGDIPDRRDFDPIMFPRLLPNIIVSEVAQNPFRIRYRLIGTKVQDVLNINITGRYLDELVDEATHTPWMDYYAEAYADRKAVMGRVTEATTHGNTFAFEFGMFPVTLGDREIRQFIAIEDYFDFNLTSAELIPWVLQPSPNLAR